MANDNTSAFVFYESFLKGIQRVEGFEGKEAAYDFLMDLIEYGLYGLIPEEDNKTWLYGFEQMKASIDNAQSRREKQIAQGKMGGRPRKIIDIEEILLLRNQGLSLRAIADRLSISPKTVSRRLEEYGQNPDTNFVLKEQDKTEDQTFVPLQHTSPLDNFILDEQDKTQLTGFDQTLGQNPDRTFDTEFHFKSEKNAAAVPAEKSSHLMPPKCGQNSRPFVSINVDKTHEETFVSNEDKTILSTNCVNEPLKIDEVDTMDDHFCGQKVKSGQNLKENKNKKVNKKDNNILSGCAAKIKDVDKTHDFSFDPIESKLPDTTFDYVEEDKSVDKNKIPMTAEQIQILRDMGYNY